MQCDMEERNLADKQCDAKSHCLSAKFVDTTTNLADSVTLRAMQCDAEVDAV